jgi:DHA1 family bicyclomycin/chloramphenicol resistance-like MFS transporter
LELSNKNNYKLLIVLSALTTIAPLSITIHVSGFQMIASDFGTTNYLVSLSLSIYLFGLAFGNLLYGPIIDRFGRRKLLVIGLIIYAVSAISCALSPTINWFIWSRFFLALGGCTGVVVSRIIVRDLFDVKKSAKFFSVLVLIIALAPILAPFIGYQLIISWGWRHLFFILASLVPFLFFGVYYLLPPLKGEDVSVNIHIIKILENYFNIFKNPVFLTFGLTTAITYASLFAYIAGSSFIYTENFGLSHHEYSWAFGINVMGLILGSQSTNLLLKKMSSIKITQIVLIYLSLVIAILLIGEIFSLISPLVFMVFMFIFIFLLGILNPNILALCLSPFENNAGIATALVGTLQMGSSAFASLLVSSFSHTLLPMLICMFFCTFFGSIVVMLFSIKYKNLFDPSW